MTTAPSPALWYCRQSAESAARHTDTALSNLSLPARRPARMIRRRTGSVGSFVRPVHSHLAPLRRGFSLCPNIGNHLPRSRICFGAEERNSPRVIIGTASSPALQPEGRGFLDPNRGRTQIIVRFFGHLCIFVGQPVRSVKQLTHVTRLSPIKQKTRTGTRTGHQINQNQLGSHLSSGWFLQWRRSS